MNLLGLLRDADRKLDTGEITIGEYKKIIAPLKDVVPVKRGRWIIRTRHEHYPSGRAYEEIVCPFCGKVDHNGDGNFCGYCGARMDGKDGEEHG